MTTTSSAYTHERARAGEFAGSMHRHRQRVGKLHIFIKYIMRYGWNDIYYCNKWTLCSAKALHCNTIKNKVNKIFSILSTFGFGRMRTRPHNRFWLAKSLLFHLRYACLRVCVCLLWNKSLNDEEVFKWQGNIHWPRCSWIYVEAKPLFVKTIIPFILNEHHFGPGILRSHAFWFNLWFHS